MPPRLDVINNPKTVLDLEITWHTKPDISPDDDIDKRREVIVLDVWKHHFELMYVADGQNVIHSQGNGIITHLVVARWDGFYWKGRLHWATFAHYFSTNAQTIWFMSRLFVNIQYENLIIDHALQLSTNLVPRWYYVGQSGARTHWSTMPGEHPTLFHTNSKEE
jgi:hypothetical protein